MRQCFIKDILPLRGGLVEAAVANVVDPISIVFYFGRLRDGLLDWGRLIRGTVLILMIATQLNRDVQA